MRGEREAEHVIRLRAPHPGQVRIAGELKRFNHCRMGRRWGKTAFGVDYLATDIDGRPGALHGYPVGWFAPTNKLLIDSWADAKALLAPAIVHKNEQHHRMRLVGGGLFEFWSLEKDDPARGRKYAKVVIDEAAMVRELLDKWYLAIRPTLTDYRGGALFASTPKGRNGFYKLEEDLRSKAPDDSAFFHAPTTENPYILASEVEAARLEYPTLAFRQEYLAEYVDFGGAIVKPDWLHHGAPDLPYPIILGVDLAISTKTGADYTAIAALSRDRQGRIYILAVMRFRLPFNEILNQIQMAAQTYRPVSVLIENNQFQASVVQELLRTTTLPVRGVRRDIDKLTAFMPVAARYEQGLVYHAPTLPAYYTEELLAFTGGPDDAHDDCVDAVSTAYLGLGHTGSSVIVANERETARLLQ